jgi:hypothetical protein
VNWLDLVEDVVIWAAAIPAVLSVFVHARTPWRRTVMGKHLMAYMSVLGIILALVAIDTMVRPDPLWFTVTQTVALVGLPIVVWWRLILQVQAQRHSLAPQHRKELDHDEQP